MPCLQASRGSKAGDDAFTAEQAATPDEEQSATSTAEEAPTEVPAVESTDATAGEVSDAVADAASHQKASSPTANADAPGSFTSPCPL